MLDAALNYVDLGYSIFPIVPGQKRPLTKNGVLDATSDAEQVERWWSAHPTANIGLATAGLIVVDVDPDSAGNPNPWLLNDLDRMRSLAVAPISLTPRGGRHFIFRQPVGGGFRNTASKIAPNVDTRADGGYIVIPPSILEGDRQYRWCEGLALDVPPLDLPEPPDWLIKLLWQEKAGESIRTTEAVPSNPIPSGQRNSALASLGGTMRKVGMSEEEIRAALLTANALRCQPPLSEEEVRTIAWSICRYEPDGIAVALVEHHAAQDRDEEESEDSGPADPGDFPTELLDVPGFIGEVVEHNLAGARKPQPALALAGALALLATLTGRKIADAYGTRTNLYLISASATSTGKERARDVNKEILHAIGVDSMIGPESFGSSAGVVSAVEAQPAILCQVDEFGRYLQTLGDARESHLYNIVTVLMRMFTSSSSIYVGDAYADTKRVKTIVQPHLCVYGTTTPAALYESLTTANLADGFLSRVLIFEGDGDPPRLSPVRPELPASIKEQAAWWSEFRPGGNNDRNKPQPIIVPTEVGARETFAAFEDLAYAEQRRLGDVLGAIWPRAVEKAHKLALLWACSTDAARPSVDVEAAEWAISVIEHLTRRLAFLASRWLSENRQESTSKRVARLIEAAGRSGLTLSQLTARTRWLTTSQRKECLESLQVAGEVVFEAIPTRTRPRTVYRHRSANL